MKLSEELILMRNREAVWKAFDNVDNLKKWQPTLSDFRNESGTPGQVGAVSRLTYMENGRTIKMTETITHRHQPVSFGGRYDAGNAVNELMNHFEATGPDETRWTMEADFRLRGFFVILGPFFRRPVVKRIREDMNRFKTMLESGDLT